MIDTVLIPQGFHLRGQQLADHCGSQIQACAVCGRPQVDAVFVPKLENGDSLAIGFCRQCSERRDLDRIIKSLLQVYYTRVSHLAVNWN